MAVITGVPIIEGVNVANAIAAIYTVPTSLKRTRIDNIAFTNYTAASVNLTVQIVESGGSAGNAKIIIDDVTIGAHETINPASALQGLSTGDTVQAVASAATSINARATGTTFTS